jgi:hypothetical protein
LKKAVTALAVMFLLSIGFTFLGALQIIFTSTLSNNPEVYSTVNNLFGVFLGFLEIGTFFSVFYLIAKHSKMVAEKYIITSMLLGVTLGSAFTWLFNIILYPSSAQFTWYLTGAANAAVSSVFCFFLPALTALLYVELKTKKSEGKNVAVTEAGAPLKS